MAKIKKQEKKIKIIAIANRFSIEEILTETKAEKRLKQLAKIAKIRRGWLRVTTSIIKD